MMIGIRRDDGGLSVMTFTEPAKDDGRSIKERIAVEVARWESGSGFKAAEWRQIDSAPPRDFRNAYELGEGGTPQVNMDKDRAIHRDAIRIARAPLLAALDTAYQRADEKGDANKKIAVAAQKQALRDAPADPEIDKAMTPEALNYVWPAALGARL